MLELTNSLFCIKVLVEHLLPKIKENAAVLAKSNVGLQTRASALVSSLAIVLLVHTYKITLQREDVLSLLICLSLEPDSTEQKCSSYEAVLDEFSEGLRK